MKTQDSLGGAWGPFPVPRVDPKPNASAIGVDHIVPHCDIPHEVRLLPRPLGCQLCSKMNINE